MWQVFAFYNVYCDVSEAHLLHLQYANQSRCSPSAYRRDVTANPVIARLVCAQCACLQIRSHKSHQRSHMVPKLQFLIQTGGAIYKICTWITGRSHTASCFGRSWVYLMETDISKCE